MCIWVCMCLCSPKPAEKKSWPDQVEVAEEEAVGVAVRVGVRVAMRSTAAWRTQVHFRIFEFNPVPGYSFTRVLIPTVLPNQCEMQTPKDNTSD
jgi:hypothetical protein